MSNYGYCPQCGAPGKTRERRPFGNDRCTNGHTYKSADARTEPMLPYRQTVTTTIEKRFSLDTVALRKAIRSACGIPDDIPSTLLSYDWNIIDGEDVAGIVVTWTTTKEEDEE